MLFFCMFENSLGWLNSRIEMTKERDSELEYRIIYITQCGKQKAKSLKKNVQSLRGLWENTKSSNILVIAVVAEEKKVGVEQFFEGIMSENLLNLMSNKLAD